MSWSGMWIGGRCGHPIRFVCCQSEAIRDAPLTISQCCGNRLPVRWLACEASRHAQFAFRLPYDRPSAPFSVSIPNYHVIIWGLSSASRLPVPRRQKSHGVHGQQDHHRVAAQHQPTPSARQRRERKDRLSRQTATPHCQDKRRYSTLYAHVRRPSRCLLVRRSIRSSHDR